MFAFLLLFDCVCVMCVCVVCVQARTQGLLGCSITPPPLDPEKKTKLVMYKDTPI